MKKLSVMTTHLIAIVLMMILSMPITANDIVYDTGLSVPVLFNGNSSNLGWTSGNNGAGGQPERWSAQPFSLAVDTQINQINAEYFVATGTVTDMGIRIWNRTGEDVPTDVDEVFSTTVVAPAVSGNDLWSEMPLGAGVELPAGDYYLTIYAIDSGGGDSTVGWFTGAPNGIQFVDVNGPWMWRAATYPTPGFEFYQLPMSVLAADQGDPNATYSAAFQLIGHPAGQVVADSVTPTRGMYIAGDVASLCVSNNVDYQMQRLSSDVSSRTEFEVMGTSPTTTPTTFQVTLEGAVFARSQVDQTIELWDYVLGAWELVDTSVATNLIDSTVVVDVVTGDLSRFVDPTTSSVEARIHFQSLNPRQRFASNTDNFFWVIE